MAGMREVFRNWVNDVRNQPLLHALISATAFTVTALVIILAGKVW